MNQRLSITILNVALAAGAVFGLVTLARVAVRALAGEPVLTLLSPAGWIGAAAGLGIALAMIWNATTALR